MVLKDPKLISGSIAARLCSKEVRLARWSSPVVVRRVSWWRPLPGSMTIWPCRPSFVPVAEAQAVRAVQVDLKAIRPTVREAHLLAARGVPEGPEVRVALVHRQNL
jgi:hypothetical protein